ncbi:MAG: U32 family peptidase [Oscillibacter sp.]|jgi:putative protease|nr:U32 family peptidase [Oscillibacter sp.]
MELLSPAGSPEALRAAVQNGAGAVYLGWGNFNARRNARNFTDREFSDAVFYCRERGVKVYLTLNTLLTDRELPAAADTAARASALGVDAVLVQDVGLLALLRRTLPDLPLHASTQMSIFTSGGACEAARWGMERIVIARECSREETAAICRSCPAEIEVFCHGALCMCYSGQCAMSALIGGRSGNRGKCAQPCRLPYRILPGGKRGFPLSLKDNCLAGELQDLERMGVACVKLEGRMKRGEYVAVVTRIYARLLREHRRPTGEELRELDAAFSRSGFTDWYWRGRKGPGMFGVRPENAAEPKELFARARADCERERGIVPMRFQCTIREKVPALLTASDFEGHTVTLSGAVPETARSRAVTEAEIAARLQKTGGTAYRCQSAAVSAAPGLSLSAADLNALRRDALAALSALRTTPPERRTITAPPPLSGWDCAAEALRFTVSVADPAQLTPELLACGPARTAIPLEHFKFLSTLPDADTEWCAILPRVWRDRDEPLLQELLEKAGKLGVTGVLLGNLGHFPLARKSGLFMYGDFGLNVFNSRALDFFREQGLRSACVSFELRLAQIRDLHKSLPAEAVVYGRLPLMITENCLTANARGCRGERNGAIVQSCPDRTCVQPHALTDRTGAAFPLLAAFGHRTEIENCRPVYLGDRPDYRRLGLTYARLRFTTETPEACAQIFRDYLSGATAPASFTRGLYERGVE